MGDETTVGEEVLLGPMSTPWLGNCELVIGVEVRLELTTIDPDEVLLGAVVGWGFGATAIELGDNVLF